MDTAIIDVTGFVDRLAASAAGASREAAREAQSELGRPLRLAVAGRVSTGKSTIVNALLGQDVAPTSAGECTRVAAAFSRGPVERAELRTLDGRRLPLPLAGSRLPDDLPVRPDEVDGIEVELMIAALDGLEIVDTPGLESLSGYDAATRRALERADALLLVLDPTGIRERDLALVRAFRGSSRSGGAARVVLVLNKADLLVEVGAGLDAALAAGRRLVARQLAPSIGAEVAAIVPAVGVVAAAVSAGVLRQAHVAELAHLAQPDAAAAPSLELRRVLGDIGVAHATSLVATGADAELRAALLAGSGFGVVRAVLDEVLLANRSTIKRVAVLERLEVCCAHRAASPRRSRRGSTPTPSAPGSTAGSTRTAICSAPRERRNCRRCGATARSQRASACPPPLASQTCAPPWSRGSAGGARWRTAGSGRGARRHAWRRSSTPTRRS